MTETFYRSFVPEVEVRSAGDGRTVSGIAVPYGVRQYIDPTLTEQFAQGAFRKQLDSAHRVKFMRNHAPQGLPIGKLSLLREDAKGLYFEARVSATELGDETLVLLRDGVLDEVSIGFQPGQERRLADGTIERTSAHLSELAVVLQGAYGQNALVSSVRAQHECTCGQRSRLDEARAVLSGLPSILPL